MKKSKRVSKRRPAAKRAWLFACALLVAGVATAAATYASRNVERPKAAPAASAASQTADPYVTVEVGGRKVRVNAQTLQQGPLTQAEAEQLGEMLEGNKATEGLVQEKHADGTVSVDLQGRFQNVVLAKRNDDGTVGAACVDTPEAARAFLGGTERETETVRGAGAPRKVTEQQ